MEPATCAQPGFAWDTALRCDPVSPDAHSSIILRLRTRTPCKRSSTQSLMRPSAPPCRNPVAGGAQHALGYHTALGAAVNRPFHGMHGTKLSASSWTEEPQTARPVLRYVP